MALCVDLKALSFVFNHQCLWQMVAALLPCQPQNCTEVTTEPTPTHILNPLPKQTSHPAFQSYKCHTKCFLSLVFFLLTRVLDQPGGPSNDKNIPVCHPAFHSWGEFVWQPLQNLICFHQFHICPPRFEMTPSVNLICGCKLPTSFLQRRFPASTLLPADKTWKPLGGLTHTDSREVAGDSARLAEQVHVWVLFILSAVLTYACCCTVTAKFAVKWSLNHSWTHFCMLACQNDHTRQTHTHTQSNTRLEQSKLRLSAVSLLLRGLMFSGTGGSNKWID